MDRRASLHLLFGKHKQTKNSKSATVTTSFDPYIGTWSFAEAAHLMRRTVFGATKEQIDQATTDGLDTTIQNLFSPQATPAPPLNYNFEDDPLVPVGETWINQLETPNVNGLRASRRRSFWAWCFKNMKDGGSNITEKLLLFWHNHFVVANTNTGRRMYTYLEFMRANATGNFRTLVEGITIDPSMLRYLNGTQNSANGPNENYARELLELFTIGKGALAGPGDYTTYTEDDVVAIARALTGWRDFDVNNNNEPTVSSFVASRHDETDKQLSNRLNNAVITNQGDQEYKTVIDIIFQQDETARHICRKLYRWFVHTDITPEVETNIIEPMAQMMIADNYEVVNALKALLSCEHFYDVETRGCMISHPIEHWFKLTNTFQVAHPQDMPTDYAIGLHFYQRNKLAEMTIHDHPTVAGWKAFYQAPQFDKLWINAVSLPLRQEFANRFMNGYNNTGFQLKINVIDFVATMDSPDDAEGLINGIASVLFAHPLTPEQVVALKDILIPGLPDYEWTIEYGDYINGDDTLEESIDNKLRAVIGTMINMPEFYLI